MVAAAPPSSARVVSPAAIREYRANEKLAGKFHTIMSFVQALLWNTITEENKKNFADKFNVDFLIQFSPEIKNAMCKQSRNITAAVEPGSDVELPYAQAQQMFSFFYHAMPKNDQRRQTVQQVMRPLLLPMI